jgi:hypothetical protein
MSGCEFPGRCPAANVCNAAWRRIRAPDQFNVDWLAAAEVLILGKNFSEKFATFRRHVLDFEGYGVP